MVKFFIQIKKAKLVDMKTNKQNCGQFIKDFVKKM